MKLLLIILLATCIKVSAQPKPEALTSSCVLVATFITVEQYKANYYSPNYMLTCKQRDRAALIGMATTVATYMLTRYVIKKLKRR
jgi:hypothetical protein